MNALLIRFETRFRGSSLRHFPFATGGGISLGFETVTATDAYQWDGLRRGGDRRQPHWLLQYSLAGWGEFEAGGVRHPVPAGQAFSARIPSRHRYAKDPACDRWTFFWIMVSHPYVVSRIFRHRELINGVLAPGDEAPAVQALAALFFPLGESPDVPDREGGLFLAMLELERWVFAVRHPAGERERMMEFVRKWVLKRLDHFLSVEELAAACGMTRSNFSHHFRQVTGQTPAGFIRDLRLQEAVRLLGRKTLSVKEVAARTGFSDANHLCRCFRAHRHMSPGMYRRLHPGG